MLRTMNKVLVILVVGLTPSLVGPHTPNLARLAKRGGLRRLQTVLPAVTCTVQSSLVSGLHPAGHGAVANGWYFRDLSEVWLWRQSNRLVAGEKIWEAGRKRDPSFTTAKMFWWYNMYASVDWSATPRPMYPADASPPTCTTSSTAGLGGFRCSTSGARRPTSRPASGSRMPRCT
jgi:predicted AlkP superfamily pyrophosphatase or phosphodiesterase